MCLALAASAAFLFFVSHKHIEVPLERLHRTLVVRVLSGLAIDTCCTDVKGEEQLHFFIVWDIE